MTSSLHRLFARGPRSIARSVRASILAGLLLTVLPCASRAQESLQELPTGGLRFAKPDNGDQIAVKSADIRISPEDVVARYVFVNMGATPVTATLSFPLPDLDFDEPDVSWAIPYAHPVNFLGLSTKTNGKAGGFAFTQKAVLNDKDVTEALRAAKLPLIPIGQFQSDLEAMPTAERDKLVDAGLLAPIGSKPTGEPLFQPTWLVRTAASRKYVFQPGETIEIEIRYKTSLGRRRDTPLRLPLRGNPDLAPELASYRKDFCTDDSIYAGIDKIAGSSESNDAGLRESRIRFNPQMGEPKREIQDFRLVVDKGGTDRIVSFCMNNLTRVSPTAFEMRAQNFIPEKELRVLLIGRK